MALADAILEIAEEMEESAETEEIGKELGWKSSLRLYARNLRRIVKAAEGQPQPIQQSAPTNEQILSAMGCDPQGPAKAAAKANRKSEKEEQGGSQSIEVVGGPMGGSDDCPQFVDVQGTPPVGGKTALGNAVYVLRVKDGRRQLAYSQEDTDKVFGVKK